MKAPRKSLLKATMTKSNFSPRIIISHDTHGHSEKSGRVFLGEKAGTVTRIESLCLFVSHSVLFCHNVDELTLDVNLLDDGLAVNEALYLC